MLLRAAAARRRLGGRRPPQSQLPSRCKAAALARRGLWPGSGCAIRAGARQLLGRAGGPSRARPRRGARTRLRPSLTHVVVRRLRPSTASIAAGRESVGALSRRASTGGGRPRRHSRNSPRTAENGVRSAGNARVGAVGRRYCLTCRVVCGAILEARVRIPTGVEASRGRPDPGDRSSQGMVPFFAGRLYVRYGGGSSACASVRLPVRVLLPPQLFRTSAGAWLLRCCSIPGAPHGAQKE